jgi:hypothetical protein
MTRASARQRPAARSLRPASLLLLGLLTVATESAPAQRRRASLLSDALGLSSVSDDGDASVPNARRSSSSDVPLLRRLADAFLDRPAQDGLRAAVAGQGPLETAARFWRALTARDVGSAARHDGAAPAARRRHPAPPTEARVAPAPRRLDTGSNGQALPPYRLLNSSLRCSGVGVPLGAGGAESSTSVSPSPSPAPAPSFVYACNAANVSVGVYDGIRGVQASGATPATVAALSAALVGVGGGVNATGGMGAVVNQSTPLPGGWQDSLTVAQVLGLQLTLGGGGGGLANATTAGALFPGPPPGTPARPPPTEAAILTLLPAPVVQAVLANDTVVCGRTLVANGTASGSNGTAPGGGGGASVNAGPCACPVEYAGDYCQYPRHFSCVATVADPLYQACVAVNAHGFEPPAAGAPGRHLASTAALGGTGNGSALLAGADADDADPGLPARAAAAGYGANVAAYQVSLAQLAWDAAAAAGYGAGSGVAVPAGGLALDDAVEHSGATLEDAREASARMPPPVSGTGYRGYRTDIAGDPPCLFLNTAHVQAAATAAAAAGSGATSGGSSNGGYGAGVVQVAFRVSCAFAEGPGTPRLTSGAVVVDPTGVPYGDRPDPGGLVAVLAAGGGAGVVAPDGDDGTAGGVTSLAEPDTVDTLQAAARRSPVWVAALGPAEWRCNGTPVTDDLLAVELPRRGYAFAPLNGTSQSTGAGPLPPPPDSWPHLRALSCLEAVFSYVVGSPDDPASHERTLQAALAADAAAAGGGTSPDAAADGAYLRALLAAERASPPFALSQPPLLPLALRVRPVSPVHLSSTAGTVMVPLPPAALDGSADVLVPVDVAATLSPTTAAGQLFWASGRLALETTVVAVPEGIAVGPWAAAQRAAAAAGGGTAPPLDPAVGPLPALPLADVVTLLAAAVDASSYDATGDGANGAVLPGPLLLTTGVARVTVDDTSWVEPTGTDWLPLALGVGIGLGVPLLAVAAYAWVRARRAAAARAAAETRALIKAIKDGERHTAEAAAAAATAASQQQQQQDDDAGATTTAAGGGVGLHRRRRDGRDGSE